MSFYFANPWGLLGLLSLPAIVAIHMYHHRYPALLIAGAHLWGAEMRMTSAGRRRQRLPITASLLLELLAALILSFVLANPTFGDMGKVVHLVAILDNSASMRAAPPGAKSFRDQAIDELQRRLTATDRQTVVTLVTTGRRVKKLIGPVGWDEAKLALAQWQPNETRHDMQVAWDRAAQVAEGSGELLFLTDHPPAQGTPLPDDLEIISFGRKLDNVGFTAARWAFDSRTAQGTIFLRIHNFGTKPTEAVIHGDAGGQRLFSRSVSLSPNAAAPAEIPVPGGVGELKVTLEAPGDPLDVDNSVVLIEPKVQSVRIQVALPENSPGRREVDKVLAVIPDVDRNAGENRHLLIGPAGELPPSDARLWWLGVGPVDPSPAAGEAARDLVGPFLLQKQHPLLSGVVLGGVVWGGVQELSFECSPIVSAGKTTLLGQLPGTSTTAFLMNLDFARSNLGESPDWPILLLNLIEQRRLALPGMQQWNYRLNEDVQFRLFEGLLDPAGEQPPPLTLKSAAGERPLVRDRMVYILGLEETGVYEVREGDSSFAKFSVNFFDPAESDLTSLAPFERAPPAPPLELFAPDDPYSWIIMLGTLLIVLLVFLDWLVLNPRSAAAR